MGRGRPVLLLRTDLAALDRAGRALRRMAVAGRRLSCRPARRYCWQAVSNVSLAKVASAWRPIVHVGGINPSGYPVGSQEVIDKLLVGNQRRPRDEVHAVADTARRLSDRANDQQQRVLAPLGEILGRQGVAP